MDEFEKYYALALRFLTFRSRSEKEIKDYLFKKKAPDNIADKILLNLKEHKFIDDLEFTKAWILSRTKYRERGMRVVKMELKRKGVSDLIIEEALEREPFTEEDTIEKLIAKKIGRYKEMDKREIREKLGAYLVRRGFEYEDVRRAIDEAMKKGV